jgi:hypothetical protein
MTILYYKHPTLDMTSSFDLPFSLGSCLTKHNTFSCPLGHWNIKHSVRKQLLHILNNHQIIHISHKRSGKLHAASAYCVYKWPTDFHFSCIQFLKYGKILMLPNAKLSFMNISSKKYLQHFGQQTWTKVITSEKQSSRWKDNIKMALKEIWCRLWSGFLAWIATSGGLLWT